MTRLQVSCRHCGHDNLLHPSQVTVWVDSAVLASPEGRYTYVCPDCDAACVGSFDRKLYRRLKAVGCVIRRATPHPEDPPDGPSLSYDDLLDLHVLLASDRWTDLL